ncbi:YesL family protein [Lederbergia sp. NSJ-179]|uniref:YesL family protein n=1 Tax=Lederbergia sp. NSJ-179 TaxID=2931402 RepID=UPI001FCFD478|nr:YesL family protein [Lederbergia sp. NSJ-179]MCJ7842443.1 YesL family protein [Lederbergia sp. NSJ-179]
MKTESFQKVGRVLGRIIILQLLFMGFIVVGLGIFGFFPALLAVMAVARQYIRETATQPIHQMFWQFYKDIFLKGNIFGLALSPFQCCYY